jgi:hypothetical protein
MLQNMKHYVIKEKMEFVDEELGEFCEQESDQEQNTEKDCDDGLKITLVSFDVDPFVCDVSSTSQHPTDNLLNELKLELEVNKMGTKNTYSKNKRNLNCASILQSCLLGVNDTLVDFDQVTTPVVQVIELDTDFDQITTPVVQVIELDTETRASQGDREFITGIEADTI